MNEEKSVVVRYYDCECEWRTKYCDEYHVRVVRIPLSVVREYENG